MLMDLRQMEHVHLLDQVIKNRWIRFLYYRCERFTDNFRKFSFLKKFFYPWYTLFHLPLVREDEDCIVFLNSGFCHELDETVLDKLKKKNENLKLVLYLVDPMTGFDKPEHLRIIQKMDLVYSINKDDCEKYGFTYYELVYSKTESDQKQTGEKADLYYLGSGEDRTEFLQKVYQRCEREHVRTSFHVLSDVRQETVGIHRHRSTVPYEENINWIMKSNCILEVMHKDFDNPTQRYSEAVVYNKKLLTNNSKVIEFEFYNPEYMKIFHSIEDIDMDFIKSETEVNYHYQNEFSPKLLIQDIDDRLSTSE